MDYSEFSRRDDMPGTDAARVSKITTVGRLIVMFQLACSLQRAGGVPLYRAEKAADDDLVNAPPALAGRAMKTLAFCVQGADTIFNGNAMQGE